MSEALVVTGQIIELVQGDITHQHVDIAFPAISTGVYGYPVDKAAVVAIGTSVEFLRESSRPSRIRFVLFSRDTLEKFAAALRSNTPSSHTGS